jgi:hypothetical protein
MTREDAEGHVANACAFLHALHCHSPKASEETGYTLPGDLDACEGESEAAKIARDMARKILDAGGCNGLGGCKLCRD